MRIGGADVRIRPGNGARARSPRTILCTSERERAWGPAGWRYATPACIATSNREFEDALAQPSLLLARRLLLRGQPGQQRIALHRPGQRVFALAGQLVIPPRRTVLPEGGPPAPPAAAHQRILFPAPQGL